jgi:dihydroorotase
VLVDTEQEHVLKNENIVSKAGWTPYDGRRVKGQPVMTFLRGTTVAEKGEVVAEAGGGRFVAQ